MATDPMPPWRPTLGAVCTSRGTAFRVWAPTKQRVDVVLEAADETGTAFPLTRAADGTFHAFVAGIGAGDRYRYRLDGEGPYPDPVSRFQPDGVHGPSAVVDACRFAWSDAGWRGVDAQELIVYELHVGTFTPAGTFAGVIERLSHVRDLGVTALELMPVADFPGARNWGYDGVALFAPARCYGCPDDLRRLVDCAHRLGLGVILDVVYNHLGPDGAYLGTFSPYYFSQRHRTPWGDAVNLDGEHGEMVRAFLIENALHWVHEYHIDGLRLDATHALVDDSPRHFLADVASCVHASSGGRRVVLIAEDHRNLAQIIRPQADDGWGLDAVWADDFHHQVRRALAGDHEGYYRDFTGSMADVAATVRRGWFYCGQHAQHFDAPRGTDPTGLSPRQFVICLENHDQVGNRAFGERLHHQIDLPAYRAAIVLLLCAPETPLLFMGQEWGASSPFLFFTDHRPHLGKLVTAGRRREFKDFSAFAAAQARQQIPDPQDPTTFFRSRLDWSEATRQPHASLLRLYRAVLGLRCTEPLLRAAGWERFGAIAENEHGVLLQRTVPSIGVLAIAVQLHGAGSIPLAEAGPQLCWQSVLDTEDPQFTSNPMPIRLEVSGEPAIYFAREGAMIVRGESALKRSARTTSTPARSPRG